LSSEKSKTRCVLNSKYYSVYIHIYIYIYIYRYTRIYTHIYYVREGSQHQTPIYAVKFQFAFLYTLQKRQDDRMTVETCSSMWIKYQINNLSCVDSITNTSPDMQTSISCDCLVVTDVHFVLTQSRRHSTQHFLTPHTANIIKRFVELVYLKPFRTYTARDHVRFCVFSEHLYFHICLKNKFCSKHNRENNKENIKTWRNVHLNMCRNSDLVDYVCSKSM
jgi:hypothetical protein